MGWCRKKESWATLVNDSLLTQVLPFSPDENVRNFRNYSALCFSARGPSWINRWFSLLSRTVAFNFRIQSSTWNRHIASFPALLSSFFFFSFFSQVPTQLSSFGIHWSVLTFSQRRGGGTLFEIWLWKNLRKFRCDLCIKWDEPHKKEKKKKDF